MARRVPIAVLASGRGSNLLAIAEAVRRGELAVDIRLVLSDRPAAQALARAHERGIAVQAIPAADYAGRAAHDEALRVAVAAAGAELVVLAGYMRILSPAFLTAFAGRVLNIHPSLLPELRGLDTHARALAAGARRHGASVHYVTAELDAGPVIAQAEVPVLESDTPDSLAARVHEAEYVLYPQVLDWYAHGRLAWRDGSVWFDERRLAAPLRVPVPAAVVRT